MNRLRTKTWIFGLLLATWGCSNDDANGERGPTPDSKPGPGPTLSLGPTPKPASNPVCSANQLQPSGALGGRDVAVTSHGIFLSKNRALFRQTDSGAALEPVTSFPEVRGPTSIVALGDSIFASVETNCVPTGTAESCSANRVFRSDDGGESWADAGQGFPAEIQFGGARLVTNGQRLIATDWEGKIASLDLETNAWSLLHPEPVPDAQGGHMLVQVIGFDGNTIVANDVYGGGLVQLPETASQWQRIEDIGEWGYTGFATRDALKVTANGGGFFANVEGVWTKTFDYDNGGVEIIDVGDAFIATDDYGKLLTSVDGIDWKTAVETNSQALLDDARLSRSGSTVAWLGPGLQVSSDYGKSWKEIVASIDDVDGVVSRPAGVYAKQAGSWFFSSGGQWSKAPWESGNLVAFDDEGTYVCPHLAMTCSYYEGAQTEPKWTTELGFSSLELRQIYASSHGLFVVPMEVWDYTLKDAVRLGLSRLDPNNGTITSASAGLPYDDPQQYWLVQKLVDVNGTLFAAVQDDWDTQATQTYRSTDGAKTWSLVRDGLLTTAVDDGRGIVALFSTGDLFRSVDAGASFTPIAPPPDKGGTTDIVMLEGRLIASRVAGNIGALWTMRDDDSWTEVSVSTTPSLGPVQDMDARDGNLWLGTATSGVWKLSAACPDPK